MLYQQAVYIGWISGLSFLALLAVTLIAKRMWDKYPFFVAYVVADLLQGVVGFLIRGHTQLYVKIYWPFELFGAFLGLGVVYEVFKNIFATYPALRRLAANVFQVAIVVLVGVGCVVMYMHSPVAGSRYVASFVIVEQGIRIVEVGLLIALFVFSSAFGLHWRQSVFGFALGLGVFATVELAGITFRAYLGPTAAPIFGLARVISFNTSLLVWLGYLLVPERVTITSGTLHKGQLEQWNQAVRELIYQ
jgi:hypothetical protein